MDVNNNSFNYNASLIENENILPIIPLTKNENTNVIVLGTSVLPVEIVEKIFHQIGFTVLQKATCVSKSWNYHTIEVLKKLDFFSIQLFMDSVYSEIDALIESTNNIINHFDQGHGIIRIDCMGNKKKIIQEQTDEIIKRQTNKKNLIKDIMNDASCSLGLSIAKNPRYICTTEDDLNHLQKTEKYLSKHTIRSLIDVELFINRLMFNITIVLENIYKSDITPFPSNTPPPIQAMFKINHFNKKETLKNNIVINYQKLVAIKNNCIDKALVAIKDNDEAFYLLFCSLMDSKSYDLALALAKEEKKEDFKTLGSYLARCGYIEAALEWVEIETDPLKKENILFGITSELFHVNNNLNMNLVFKTLLFIDKNFEMKSFFIKIEKITYWLKKYKTQKSDDIDFALKTISCFTATHQIAMRHALFIGMINSNPVSEVYDNEVVNQIIPNSEIKHKVLLEHFFSNSFAYEKTMEIARFIPADFYYNKEDFILLLESTQEITPILAKHSSPKNYIISLKNENRLDEFLTFFDQVSNETYQEIVNEKALILIALTVKLAENNYKEKARELADMLPKPTADFLIKKYVL